MPQKVFTIVAFHELENLQLEFQNNLLIQLPLKELLKWMAFERLGSLALKNNEIKFIPGITRLDIYCPSPTKIAHFDIIALLHQYKVGIHFDMMTKLFQFKEIFEQYNLWGSSFKCEAIYSLTSTIKFQRIIRNVKVRAKRRARLSISNSNINTSFFTFLSAKGHYNWHIIY